MRLLLDENLAPSLPALLRRRGIAAEVEAELRRLEAR